VSVDKPSIDPMFDIGEYVVVKVDGTEEVVHEKPLHGVDGWVLLDMEWHPKSGLATYDYAKYDATGKYLASHCRIVRQPCADSHEGWDELWNEPVLVLTR
jgi:hypothetical protein